MIHLGTSDQWDFSIAVFDDQRVEFSETKAENDKHDHTLPYRLWFPKALKCWPTQEVNPLVKYGRFKMSKLDVLEHHVPDWEGPHHGWYDQND